VNYAEREQRLSEQRKAALEAPEVWKAPPAERGIGEAAAEWADETDLCYGCDW